MCSVLFDSLVFRSFLCGGLFNSLPRVPEQPSHVAHRLGHLQIARHSEMLNIVLQNKPKHIRRTRKRERENTRKEMTLKKTDNVSETIEKKPLSKQTTKNKTNTTLSQRQQTNTSEYTIASKITNKYKNNTFSHQRQQRTSQILSHQRQQNK